MSYLERIAYILGTLLIGVSTYVAIDRHRAVARSRRRNNPPVEELASELQQAWSGYHQP